LIKFINSDKAITFFDIFNKFWSQRYEATAQSHSLEGITVQMAEQGGGCFTGDTQILMANSATDEISGIAAPNSYVDLETCGFSGCHSRTALADSNGYWSVNFGVIGDQAWEQTIFDIQPGTNGNLRQWDNDIDTTMIQWTASDYVFLPLIVH